MRGAESRRTGFFAGAGVAGIAIGRDGAISLTGAAGTAGRFGVDRTAARAGSCAVARAFDLAATAAAALGELVPCASHNSSVA